MDATSLRTIQVLVREDAWPGVKELYPEDADLSEALDSILAVEGSLPNVAAYLLEQLCAGARLQATEAGQGEVKKMKDVSGEMEFFPSTAPQTTSADTFCARAASLREGQSRWTPLPAIDPWGVL